jgi:hypothetical protein
VVIAATPVSAVKVALEIRSGDSGPVLAKMPPIRDRETP